MGNKFSTLKSIVAILTLIGIFFIGFKSLFFLILLIPIYIFELKKEEAEEKEKFKKFLSQIKGKNFFCYNNKVKGKKFIENKIIPFFNKNIEIIYLNGKILETDEQNKEHLSRILNNFHSYSKFPNLFKIRNGKIIEKSINNDLFNCISNRKSIEDLNLKINLFLKGQDSFK